MRLSVLPFVAAAVVSPVLAETRLLHRVYNPALPKSNPEFTERGIILHNQLVPSDTSAIDYSTPGLLYQVALPSGAFSSVPLCHLASATSETIILHNHAETIDYFVSPVPHNGACSEGSTGKSIQLKDRNVTISIHSPRLPPLPTLFKSDNNAAGASSAPVTITPDGSPAPKVEGEKSFFDKYWMYIIAILIGLLLSGVTAPPAEPEQDK